MDKKVYFHNVRELKTLKFDELNYVIFERFYRIHFYENHYESTETRESSSSLDKKSLNVLH